MSSQTDNLHLYKVDSSDKITDTWNNYNTNMDLIDGKLATVYKYKGAVAGTSNLPGNAEVGDVYDVTSTGMNYAWDGTQWDALGSVFTLPTASTTTLGGVKLDGTTITADNNGVISAIGGGGGVQSDDVTNIVVSSTDIGTGATLTNGTLYLVYEE